MNLCLKIFNPHKLYDSVLAPHILEHVDKSRNVISKVGTGVAPGVSVIAVSPNAQSLHRQLAVSMGLKTSIDHLSPRDQLVEHQRVNTQDELVEDFEAEGLIVEQRLGYFLKIVPKSTMREWSSDLLIALTSISDSLPQNLVANNGIVARKVV